jgi:hypothetical protein
MVIGLTSGDPETVNQLLHPTGEFAARFMIIAMMITPLMMLSKGWRGPRRLIGAGFFLAELSTNRHRTDGPKANHALTVILVRSSGAAHTG